MHKKIAAAFMVSLVVGGVAHTSSSSFLQRPQVQKAKEHYLAQYRKRNSRQAALIATAVALPIVLIAAPMVYRKYEQQPVPVLEVVPEQQSKRGWVSWGSGGSGGNKLSEISSQLQAIHNQIADVRAAQSDASQSRSMMRWMFDKVCDASKMTGKFALNFCMAAVIPALPVMQRLKNNIKDIFVGPTYSTFFGSRNYLFAVMRELDQLAVYLDPYAAVHDQVAVPLHVQFKLEKFTYDLTEDALPAVLLGNFNAKESLQTALQHLEKENSRVSKELRAAISKQLQHVTVKHQRVQTALRQVERPNEYFIMCKVKLDALTKHISVLRGQLADALGFALAFEEQREHDSDEQKQETLLFLQTQYQELITSVNQATAWIELWQARFQAAQQSEQQEEVVEQLLQESKDGNGLSTILFPAQQTMYNLWTHDPVES